MFFLLRFLFQENACLNSGMADGYCDDINNNLECGFDRGDCCNNHNPHWDTYCNDCEYCLIDNVTCIDEWIGNDYCEDINNKLECRFDEGDCCNNPEPDWDRYCDDGELKIKVQYVQQTFSFSFVTKF